MVNTARLLKIPSTKANFDNAEWSATAHATPAMSSNSPTQIKATGVLCHQLEL